MVRLLCQNFQSPCSGGSSPDYVKVNEDTMEMRCFGAALAKEMIDRDMAERAVQAVSDRDDNHENFDFNNFNSSSGSDCSCDSDNDQGSLVIAAESEDSQSGDGQDMRVRI